MTSFWTIALLVTLQQPIDGTALNFTVEKDYVTVRVGRWKMRSNKASEINRFVDFHLKAIDPDKIFVYGDGKAKYPSFQLVIEVLKKHDWIKFKFVDNGAKGKKPEKKIDGRRSRANGRSKRLNIVTRRYGNWASTAPLADVITRMPPWHMRLMLPCYII